MEATLRVPVLSETGLPLGTGTVYNWVGSDRADDVAILNRRCTSLLPAIEPLRRRPWAQENA